MPKAEEVATITVNGQKFSNWESVHVETNFHAAARLATFVATEKVGRGVTFSTLQIKPGDRCTIALAGLKVLTGIVYGRQATIDGNSHGVVISVRDDSGEAVHGSVPLKGSQMRGYAFEPIAKALLKPFGINLKMVNVPSYASKPFKDMNTWPGETVFECLDRLAKMRGMFIRSDADGNMVVGGGSTQSTASFVEGQNIKSASCLVRDDTLKSTIAVVGQGRGDDHTTDDQSRAPAAQAQGNSSYYRPHIVLSEEPGDSEDMKHRADHENRWLAGKTIQCNVTVQGWLTPQGTLWNVEDCFTVNSPSLLLDNALLGAQSIIFSQDSQTGTMTSISMVRPDARNGEVQPVTEPAGGLPGGNLNPAEPEST